MMHRMTFAAGVAVGYVLGAHAGRERYEALRRTAERVMGNPQVQETATRLGHQAGDLASQAGHKVTERVGDRLPFGHRDEEPAGYGAPNGRRF
jgi:hypothetical protein